MLWYLYKNFTEEEVMIKNNEQRTTASKDET